MTFEFDNYENIFIERRKKSFAKLPDGKKMISLNSTMKTNVLTTRHMPIGLWKIGRIKKYYSLLITQ